MTTPNPKPGIYHGMPIAEYHGYSGAISKSGLDDIARSPAIFKALRSPGAPGREETPAQLHGNLCHTAFLEPDQFAKRYIITPNDAPRRPTEAQWNAKDPSPSSVASMKWWKAFNDQCVGKQLITWDQHEIAISQANSLNSLTGVFHGLTMAEIMASGRPEVSAFWNDPQTGVLCRCRPDWVHELADGSVLLIDCKTVGAATEDGFLMQARKLRYFVQDFWYSHGYEIASGKRVAGFVFAVTETRFPFASASYRLGDQTRHEGYLQSRKNLDLYAHCLKHDTWPGISSQTTTVDLPLYALTEEEVELPE